MHLKVIFTEIRFYRGFFNEQYSVHVLPSKTGIYSVSENIVFQITKPVIAFQVKEPTSYSPLSTVTNHSQQAKEPTSYSPLNSVTKHSPPNYESRKSSSNSETNKSPSRAGVT